GQCRGLRARAPSAVRRFDADPVWLPAAVANAGDAGDVPGAGVHVRAARAGGGARVRAGVRGRLDALRRTDAALLSTPRSRGERVERMNRLLDPSSKVRVSERGAAKTRMLNARPAAR